MTDLPVHGTTTSSESFDGGIWIGAELDEVAVESSSLRRLRGSGGTWTRTSFIDCALDGADLAGVVTTDSSLVRCTLDGARLTGSQWLRSRWRQLDATELVADTLSAHGSTWTDVTLTGARLRELDLSEAKLVRVRFVDCDLTRARFAGVRCSDVTLSGCTLDAITGVTGLRGAHLARTDAASALPALAAELGIRVIDD
ncbi:pentapeptide repeat-containing protein [Pseudactinotalea terrae]|uniref:pentapeptide repeat-containing protein n=1 Tax=Pseudactinotalea terrae TaxID=1743262 RepID=UPI0012E26822|nr:pentapeptide repeat-containing protein [Pseudactinotalea terrae]